MDVELQILKHLARDPRPTVAVIDEYCNCYKDLFTEVRSYECWKYLHLGIISPIKRKSLPEIAKVVGINSAQSLHHFIAQSPWSVVKVRQRRLSKTLSALKGKKITVVIDETGDQKKGKKTDYVARQYLGSVGKVDRGIVSVNAYGIYQNMTFPLMFKVFKPKGTLKTKDLYKTKIELASEIIEELIDYGFSIELVLARKAKLSQSCASATICADALRLYGEASSFIATLNKYKLAWILAIRNNHGVWMPSSQKVRANKWCKFERTFSNQKSETRYIREIIYGKRNRITYWELTTDTETMPENSTSFVMTNIQDTRSKIKKILGDLYGLRTWVEYGFRQCKQELGWTDYRFTNFESIEKWWEIIMSTYWMISCHSKVFLDLNQSSNLFSDSVVSFSLHQQWSTKVG